MWASTHIWNINTKEYQSSCRISQIADRSNLTKPIMICIRGSSQHYNSLQLLEHMMLPHKKRHIWSTTISLKHIVFPCPQDHMWSTTFPPKPFHNARHIATTLEYMCLMYIHPVSRIFHTSSTIQRLKTTPHQTNSTSSHRSYTSEWWLEGDHNIYE
jgi:hypothetical protein